MDTDISKKKIKDYDAMAKSILACKDVIANILKYTVREFKDYSVSEIIPYINGEPEIGTEEVDDSILPKIDAAGAEAVSVSDGGRMFDIKFRVRIPGGDSEAVLIINIEAQKKYHLAYYIERRGIYYLSRLISSQYGTEFQNSDYNKIKKVYSIWICMDSPQKYANTVTEYRLRPENIVGESESDPKRYDLMSLVIIKLGKSERNYEGIIRMLDLLFNKLDTDRKNSLTALKDEFGISSLTLKEADSMCNLGMGIYERGIDKGHDIGFNEGINKGINIGIDRGRILTSIKTVNKLVKTGYTLEKALEFEELDKETYDKYKEE